MAVVEGEGTFSVRRATSLDDMQWVVQKGTEEGWRTRATDGNSYFMAGVTQDFFIGELNGERISCISIVRHGETLAFVGFFIAIPSFRGKGYGLKTWKAAFEHYGTDLEFQLYSVTNMQHAYMKFGFQPGWIARRYIFSCDRAAEGLSECKLPSSVSKILPGCEVNFDKLVAYGTDVMISSQASKSVLAAWLSSAQKSSWVAIGNEGEILGYLIMNATSRFAEEGYRIGPFFADSVPVARSLFKMAVEYATPNNPGCLFMDVPKGTENDTMAVKELGGKHFFDCIFMGTKDIPNIPLGKVFGFPSLEVL